MVGEREGVTDSGRQSERERRPAHSVPNAAIKHISNGEPWSC